MERHPLALGGPAHPHNPIKADGWPSASAVAQANQVRVVGRACIRSLEKPAWSQKASSRPRMCHLAGKYCFTREMMVAFARRGWVLDRELRDP